MSARTQRRPFAEIGQEVPSDVRRSPRFKRTPGSSSKSSNIVNAFKRKSPMRKKQRTLETPEQDHDSRPRTRSSGKRHSLGGLDDIVDKFKQSLKPTNDQTPDRTRQQLFSDDVTTPPLPPNSASGKSVASDMSSQYGEDTTISLDAFNKILDDARSDASGSSRKQGRRESLESLGSDDESQYRSSRRNTASPSMLRDLMNMSDDEDDEIQQAIARGKAAANSVLDGSHIESSPIARNKLTNNVAVNPSYESPTTTSVIKATPLKSCMSSRKSRIASMKKNVAFGSPNAAEFDLNQPVKGGMTPMRKEDVRTRFQMSDKVEDEDEEDEDTARNTSILATWDEEDEDDSRSWRSSRSSRRRSSFGSRSSRSDDDHTMEVGSLQQLLDDAADPKDNRREDALENKDDSTVEVGRLKDLLASSPRSNASDAMDEDHTVELGNLSELARQDTPNDNAKKSASTFADDDEADNTVELGSLRDLTADEHASPKSHPEEDHTVELGSLNDLIRDTPDRRASLSSNVSKDHTVELGSLSELTKDSPQRAGNNATTSSSSPEPEDRTVELGSLAELAKMDGQGDGAKNGQQDEEDRTVELGHLSDLAKMDATPRPEGGVQDYFPRSPSDMDVDSHDVVVQQSPPPVNATPKPNMEQAFNNLLSLTPSTEATANSVRSSKFPGNGDRKLSWISDQSSASKRNDDGFSDGGSRRDSHSSARTPTSTGREGNLLDFDAFSAEKKQQVVPESPPAAAETIAPETQQPLVDDTPPALPQTPEQPSEEELAAAAERKSRANALKEKIGQMKSSSGSNSTNLSPNMKELNLRETQESSEEARAKATEIVDAKANDAPAEQPVAPVKLDEFLKMSNVEFAGAPEEVDISKLNETEAHAVPNTDDITLGTLLKYSRHLPHTKALGWACGELKRRVEDSHGTISQLQAAMDGDQTPDLFKMVADKLQHNPDDEQLEASFEEARQLKQLMQLQVKIEWYQWRGKLVAGVQEALVMNLEDFTEDCTNMQQSLNNVTQAKLDVCKQTSHIESLLAAIDEQETVKQGFASESEDIEKQIAAVEREIEELSQREALIEKSLNEQASSMQLQKQHAPPSEHVLLKVRDKEEELDSLSATLQVARGLHMWQPFFLSDTKIGFSIHYDAQDEYNSCGMILTTGPAEDDNASMLIVKLESVSAEEDHLQNDSSVAGQVLLQRVRVFNMLVAKMDEHYRGRQVKEVSHLLHDMEFEFGRINELLHEMEALAMQRNVVLAFPGTIDTTQVGCLAIDLLNRAEEVGVKAVVGVSYGYPQSRSSVDVQLETTGDSPRSREFKAAVELVLAQQGNVAVGYKGLTKLCTALSGVTATAS